MISTELCGLDQKTQEVLIDLFSKYPKIEKVVLYGSRAKGNFKNGSDIDLALVAPQLSHQELLALQNEIDDLLLPYKVDSLLFHQIDNPALVEHIQRVGLNFYRS